MERALEAARRSGLIRAGEPLLVLLSGGVDSTCLLDVCVRLEARVHALHVNYGLREEAAEDEHHCRELCARLEVPLAVETAGGAPAGNLQAWARDLRYGLAERIAEGDYATGHTASDQAETVVYRLAVSPGRRALLGMASRRGRLVRPLLEVTRRDTVEHCRARGLTWREDASNVDPRFARARVREEVLPVLADLNPEAELTIAETARLLGDEAEVLEAAVDEVLARGGGHSVATSDLRSEPPALARLVLRRMAEEAHGGARSLTRRDADAILHLASGGGSASLDLGSGLRAIVEYGILRFSQAEDREPPEPVVLSVPGAVSFGPWRVEARSANRGDPVAEDAALSAAGALGGSALVRTWRPGDRMRPAGLGGSKSLQDLFTDRKVPRGLRRDLPVVEAAGEIAWVAGVAIGERFVPGDDEAEVIALSARRSGA